MPRKEKNERTKEGEERGKNGSEQRAKPSTPTLAIDALLEEEEQSGKQKWKEEKKQLPWTMWSPLTTFMDHTLGIF